MSAATEAKPERPSLSIVKPEERPLTANLLLYGPQKIGKSTAAAGGPPKVLYLNCDLPNAMLHPRKVHGDKFDEIQVTGLKDLIDVGKLIKHDVEAGTLEYSTVVVDPMHDLYRILSEDLTGRALRPQVQYLGDAQTHIERFARQMCAHPINTVFVAHETKTVDASGNAEAIPFMGTTNDKPAGKLMGMVDVIAYCAVIENEGQTEYVAQLKAANNRRAGDRFDTLDKLMPLDLATWFRLITPPQDSQKQDTTHEAPQQVQEGAKAA